MALPRTRVNRQEHAARVMFVTETGTSRIPENANAERFVERLYELTAQVGGARRDVRRGRRRLSCATWIPAPI